MNTHKFAFVTTKNFFWWNHRQKCWQSEPSRECFSDAPPPFSPVVVIEGSIHSAHPNHMLIKVNPQALGL